MGRDITDWTQTQIHEMNFRVKLKKTNIKHNTHVGLSDEKRKMYHHPLIIYVDMCFYSSKYSMSMFNSPIQHGPRAAAPRKASFIQPQVFTVTVTWATQYVETCP